MTSKEAYARVSLDNLIALKRAASYSNIPKPANQKADSSVSKSKDTKQQRPGGSNSGIKETSKSIKNIKPYVNNENILPNEQHHLPHRIDGTNGFNATTAVPPLRQGSNSATTTAVKTSGHRQSYSMMNSSGNQRTATVSPKPNSMSSSKLAYPQQTNNSSNYNNHQNLPQHLVNKHYLHTRILTDHNNNNISSSLADNSTNASMLNGCYPLTGGLNHTNNADSSQSKSFLCSIVPAKTTNIQSIITNINNNNNNLNAAISSSKKIIESSNASQRALSAAKQQSHLKTTSPISSRDLNNYICTESSQHSLPSQQQQHQQQQQQQFGSFLRLSSEEQQKISKSAIIVNTQQSSRLKEKEYQERIRRLECANKSALDSLRQKEATVNALRVEMHLQQQQHQILDHNTTENNHIESRNPNVLLQSDEATLTQQEEQVRQLQQLSAIMEDKVQRLEANLTRTTAATNRSNSATQRIISYEKNKPPSSCDRLPTTTRQEDQQSQQDSLRQKTQQLEYMCSQLSECIMQQRIQQTELIREMEFILSAQQGKTNNNVLKVLGLSESQQSRIKQGLQKSQN